MVTAGQWQAVKDTLSRPKGRSLTTSDTSGNSITNTAYNNLSITLINLMIWFSRYNKNYFTLHDQYNNLYVMKPDKISNLYAMPRYSNLAYSYTTTDSASFSMILWYYWNLTHYYTTMYTATLMIWYSCYNNQLYMTWYNNLSVMTLIQLPSLLL